MNEKEFVEGISKALSKNLACVASYGKGESKIAVVVDSFDPSMLALLSDLPRKWLKGSGSLPLILTREELSDGADVFPLDFLYVKSTKKVLAGEDVLEQVTVDKQHVRRHLEFEFRSKLIHLREGLMEVGDDKKKLQALLGRAIPTLMPILYGLLYVKDAPVPENVEDVLHEVTSVYGVSLAALDELEHSKVSKLGSDELSRIARQLMLFLAEIGEIVDEMQI